MEFCLIHSLPICFTWKFPEELSWSWTTVTLGVSLSQSLQEVGSRDKGWLRCLVTTPSKSLMFPCSWLSSGHLCWKQELEPCWFSGLGTALCLSLALENLCFGSICLSSSGGVLWGPTCLITTPTTVMNRAAMPWAPNHVPRAPWSFSVPCVQAQGNLLKPDCIIFILLMRQLLLARQRWLS